MTGQKFNKGLMKRLALPLAFAGAVAGFGAQEARADCIGNVEVTPVYGESKTPSVGINLLLSKYQDDSDNFDEGWDAEFSPLNVEIESSYIFSTINDGTKLWENYLDSSDTEFIPITTYFSGSNGLGDYTGENVGLTFGNWDGLECKYNSNFGSSPVYYVNLDNHSINEISKTGSQYYELSNSLSGATTYEGLLAIGYEDVNGVATYLNNNGYSGFGDGGQSGDAVPEPCTALLLGASLLGAAGYKAGGRAIHKGIDKAKSLAGKVLGRK